MQGWLDWVCNITPKDRISAEELGIRLRLGMFIRQRTNMVWSYRKNGREYLV